MHKTRQNNQLTPQLKPITGKLNPSILIIQRGSGGSCSIIVHPPKGSTYLTRDIKNLPHKIIVDRANINFCHQ